nr:FHIPEP family type III secretion protein [Pseudomonas putida]
MERLLNIALSIVVLLVCVYALRPLDFAAFPTILLSDSAGFAA